LLIVLLRIVQTIVSSTV